jgi:hypothetical protein
MSVSGMVSLAFSEAGIGTSVAETTSGSTASLATGSITGAESGCF